MAVETLEDLHLDPRPLGGVDEGLQRAARRVASDEQHDRGQDRREHDRQQWSRERETKAAKLEPGCHRLVLLAGSRAGHRRAELLGRDMRRVHVRDEATAQNHLQGVR